VTLIILSISWLTGIYIGYYLNLPLMFCLLALVPLPFLFFNKQRHKAIILFCLAIFLLTIGSFYAYGSLYSVDESNIRFYNDTGKKDIKTVVAAMPDVRDKSTRLTLAVEEIYIENGWQEAGGKILAVVPRYPGYEYGDLLNITGELETPTAIDDFDYAGYLAHQGIYTTIYYPRIEVLDKGRGFLPLAWINNLRGRMADAIAATLPEPQASLAQGILLGMRGNIPADLNNAFANSGAAHLLAISGANLAIMAGILLGIGLWLFGRRGNLYIWLALGVIWFYTIITGLNPPVVRGAIMASLFLLAEALGRQRSGMAALVFAAAVMVGVNPYTLGDASFQLSFLAMAGLIFIYPVLRDTGRRLIASKMGDEGWLVSTLNMGIDCLSATLAAIIAVWPLIAYYFGIFSLAGPLATFLLTPVLPVIIIIGTLTALVGLASIPAAHVFGWLAWPFLSFMILVVNGLGTPSLASVKVGSLSPVFIVCYYIVLVLLVWLHSRWQKVRNLMSGAAGMMKAGVTLTAGFKANIKWAIVPLLIAATLVGYTAAAMPGDELRVSFLDVGQGDAIFIQKGDQQILIDGGPSPQSITLELSRRMAFWDRNIDLVVLTHPHQDHIAGLLEVLRRYDVGQALYPSSDYKSSLSAEWSRLMGEAGLKSTVACAGQRIALGDNVTLEVLWPDDNAIIGTDSDVDNNSVVLLLKAGRVSFLLTGDSMSETEWQLIRERADIQGTVIKVAHHGSASSTTAEFLSVVNPQIAVISVASNNTYNLPNSAVVTRLGEKVGEANVYFTKDGTITFITDGERLWVEGE
jgi:competence protein ComEC